MRGVTTTEQKPAIQPPNRGTYFQPLRRSTAFHFPPVLDRIKHFSLKSQREMSCCILQKTSTQGEKNFKRDKWYFYFNKFSALQSSVNFSLMFIEYPPDSLPWRQFLWLSGPLMYLHPLEKICRVEGAQSIWLFMKREEIIEMCSLIFINLQCESSVKSSS